MQVSISKIKLFKACRRMYFLKYVEGLEPVQKSDALQIGSNYHSRLESLYKGEEQEQDFSKESAMVQAYKKYIYPHFEVLETEKYLEKYLGDDDMLIGYADGIAKDEHIVEHKTTGIESLEQYEYNLMWDEQILAYMLLTGKNKVWYTICKKPTIRLKKGESDEEFYDRMVEWYDVDTQNKIRLLEIERDFEEIEQFKRELLDIVKEMRDCEHFYKNTCHCHTYGRQCEYSGVCLNYDPDQEYCEFTKREKE